MHGGHAIRMTSSSDGKSVHLDLSEGGILEILFGDLAGAGDVEHVIASEHTAHDSLRKVCFLDGRGRSGLSRPLAIAVRGQIGVGGISFAPVHQPVDVRLSLRNVLLRLPLLRQVSTRLEQHQVTTIRGWILTEFAGAHGLHGQAFVQLLWCARR